MATNSPLAIQHVGTEVCPELGREIGIVADTEISGQPHRLVALDGMNPQDVAMLQALYSRDPKTVLSHLSRVAAKGAGSFMGTYYVGYGHKSIGDCGTTTLFIEGLSMLAAKAVQDWALYSGQESSTRYLDFSAQPIHDPLGRPDIQQAWMRFYFDARDPLIEDLRRRYPRREEEDEKIYERAIAARSFDILRGFLPAGASTNVAWHTNLRQAADHLQWLRYHPLAEVRELAERVEELLKARYPESFSWKRYEATEDFMASAMREIGYIDVLRVSEAMRFSSSGVSLGLLKTYDRLLGARPTKAELPSVLREIGNIRFEFLLDFGSYRDLQRQRSVVIPMPLLTVRHGFEPWYIEQLPEAMRASAERLIEEQRQRINALDTDRETRQYYTAMGFRCPIFLTANLPAAVYVIELRSGKTVHPTLRRRAHEMARLLRERLPQVALHADLDPDDWDVRRGAQTIEAK